MLGIVVSEGCMQGREVIIRYGDGTEQTLPSVTAAVMHLNISASRFWTE